MKSSGGATDEEKTALICRRSAADIFLLTVVLGLTPQARDLSPLRGS
jgi:hypothetical protein